MLCTLRVEPVERGSYLISELLYPGLCYCTDCQKASGSGFIPFMGFASSAVRFSGRTLQYTTKAANGGDAVRNSCPVCGCLVFGGSGGQGQLIYDLRRHAG
jgi:hypothetical protein